MKKKILLNLILLLPLCLILTACGTVEEQKKDTVTLLSSDSKFELQLPKEIEYRENQKQDNEYTIDLYSLQDEMYFYATSVTKERAMDLKGIVENDKKKFMESSQNVTEQTEVTPVQLKDYSAYEYSFIHFDEKYGKDFYSKIVWIETNHAFYVFNFDVITQNAEKYKPIFETIIQSFKELE